MTRIIVNAWYMPTGRHPQGRAAQPFQVVHHDRIDDELLVESRSGSHVWPAQELRDAAVLGPFDTREAAVAAGAA